MALTDTEKKQLKNKFNNYVDTMSNALDVSKTEVKKIISKHNTNGTLSEIYSDYSKKKDKFKGGVPGGFSRYFSNEMLKANELIKKDKRQAQEGNYNKKTDSFKRKGPRGDRTKKYSNSVKIIE